MKKRIFVEGMKCEKCAGHINEALVSLEGVIVGAGPGDPKLITVYGRVLDNQ